MVTHIHIQIPLRAYCMMGEQLLLKEMYVDLLLLHPNIVLWKIHVVVLRIAVCITHIKYRSCNREGRGAIAPTLKKCRGIFPTLFNNVRFK